MIKKLFFITVFLAVLINLIGETVNEATSRIDYSKEKTLLVVGTAHLDTQWRWTIQKTITDFVPNTLRKNFDLFEKFPHYVFSFEGAFRYMLAKEYYPEDYAKLKDYIAKNRWFVCGSFVDACDVNVPSPESLIRQVLYGNGFFKEEFGKRSCDIFLPDCFGFGYALPSIANHCGLKGFSTQKLSWGSSVGIPFDIGIWEGVDSSSIIAAINPGDYTSKIEKDLSTDEKYIKIVEDQGEKSGVYVGYKYFGVGDTGGAPDEKSVEWLEKSINNDNGKIHITSAPADKLFRDLTTKETEKLPKYKGELLMKTHATGCYTSQTAMKRWNRKNEFLANACESSSIIADWLGVANYPKEKIKEAWIRFLWHQFHDDLTGTSIPEAYLFSWNDELISQNQFVSVLKNAVGGITRELDTQVKGIPIVVFNPLSIDREDIVCAKVKFPQDAPDFVKVYDPNGNEVLSQVISRINNIIEVCFLSKVPSVGLSVYDIVPANEPCSIQSSLQITKKTIENKHYKIIVNKNGDVSSIFDKNENRELLSAPVRLELLKNISNDWPAWEIKYETVEQKSRAYVNGPAKIRIIENGPVRATLEVIRSVEDSNFIQRISLSSRESKDCILFDSEIDWKTKGTLLKAAFPLKVSNSQATYDLGVGTIERGNNNPNLYEVPAQQWADITNTDGSYGVAVLNDCKYGWDKPNNNTLRLTLIHTPYSESRYSDQHTMDIGNHKMLYAIYGHKGNWRDGEVSWESAQLNQPLIAFQTKSHSGSLGKNFSMLKLNTSQVAVKSLKKSEETDEIVIRLQELKGKPAKDVIISMAGKIASAKEINGVEEPIKDVPVVDGKIKFDMEPYRPIAFAVKLEKSSVPLNPPICKPIDLTFNLDAVSFDNDKTDGDFDRAGSTFPAELFPKTLVSEDIAFTFGSTEQGQKNVLICQGQEIQIPEGDYDHIYILADSINSDEIGRFKIDGKDFRIPIEDYSENIGQWNSRIGDGKFTEDISLFDPPYIKTDSIAWIGTHKHNQDGQNEPYKFCYIFKYSIPMPKGAKTLSLPNNENIRIFAITSASNPNEETTLAQPLYDKLYGIPLQIKTKTRMFIDSITVPINCKVKDSEIRYTLDGSEPTRKSTLYTEPIKLTETTTLKCKGIYKTVQDIYCEPSFTEEGNVTTIKFTKVQPKEAQNPENLIQGLSYNYYEGDWEKLPDFDKLKPIKTGRTENFSLVPRLRDEKYAIRFDGFINVPADDIYNFYVKSDDGGKLYIGEIEVVNNDGIHGADEKSGSIALKAGKHPITVIFFQRLGGYFLEVGYGNSNQKESPINLSELFCLKNEIQ